MCIRDSNVDLLCIVAESTPIGLTTARRIFELAKQLPISVKEIGIIWNRADTTQALDDIETFGCVPYDKAVFDASMKGKTIFDIRENCPALLAISEVLKRKLNLESP